MVKTNKQRLDNILMMRNYADNRSKAQAMILSGSVEVNGKIIDKCGALIDNNAKIKILKKMQYVSRGGEKLAGALKDFKLQIANMIALDIGTSTGGFTDCLLQNKVKKVYAVDVGHGQLDPKIRNDNRVIVIEKFNAKFLNKDIINEKIDLITIDVSFISLKKILPVLNNLYFSGYVIALIKPQFEAGRKYVKKGVVKDLNVISKIIEDIKNFSLGLGFAVIDVKPSVLKGPKGNIEYFILLYGTAEAQRAQR